MALPEFVALSLAAVASIAAAISINSAVLFFVLRQSGMKDNKLSKAVKAGVISGTIIFFATQILLRVGISTGNSITTTAILFGAVPLLSLAVNFYLLGKMYRLKGKKAALTALSWTVAAWLVSYGLRLGLATTFK